MTTEWAVWPSSHRRELPYEHHCLGDRSILISSFHATLSVVTLEHKVGHVKNLQERKLVPRSKGTHLTPSKQCQRWLLSPGPAPCPSLFSPSFLTYPWMQQQYFCMLPPLQWDSPSGKGYQLIMSKRSDDQFICNSSQARFGYCIIQGVIPATPIRRIKRDVQMERWAFVLEGGCLAYLETQPFLKLINPLKELWVMD